jgi:hypothetical protein
MRLVVLHALLARHPWAALLAPVVAASGIVGFASGQVVGHASHRRAPAPLAPITRQSTEVMQGALGQRLGGQVAHQTVVRTVYVPATTPSAAVHTSAQTKNEQSAKVEDGSQGKHKHGAGHDKKHKGSHKGHHDGGRHGKGGHGDRGGHGDHHASGTNAAGAPASSYQVSQ